MSGDARVAAAERPVMLHRVGAVAEITGLPAHVLRYWETEFPQLRPAKSPGGQRLYSAADVELVLRIKHLLHERRFTIAGARRRLVGEQQIAGTDAGELAEALEEIRGEIRAILTLLDADDKQ